MVLIFAAPAGAGAGFADTWRRRPSRHASLPYEGVHSASGSPWTRKVMSDSSTSMRSLLVTRTSSPWLTESVQGVTNVVFSAAAKTSRGRLVAGVHGPASVSAV